MRFDDFTRATRSHTLNEATDHTETILYAARTLLSSPVWNSSSLAFQSE